MKITSSIFLLAIACLSQPSAGAVSADFQAAIHKVMQYPSGVNVKAGSYIVELDGTPSSANIQAVANSVTSSFTSNLAPSAPKFTIGKHFTELFNGFALHANKDFDPVHIASVPGVKRIWPNRIRTLQYQQSPANITYPYLHHATGVDTVVQNLGFTGKGIKIGVIDSGVDYNHPELGNCWKTPGCMWQFGADLVGDDFNPSDPVPAVKPGPHPMDCMGHGTHVAGIIAGQGPKVIGVAQEATMGMYRVFGCPKNGKEPTTSDEYIIAGIEGAYKDGANIISLSLGGGGWPEDPTSVVCSNMVKKGVVVVVANGNEGDAGLFTAGSPGLGRGVISVGSIDNWNITGNALGVVSAAGTKQLLMSTPANENIPFVFDNNVPLVAVVDSTNSNLGCATINQDLKGKVALIKRGTCTFAEKAANAQTAGATGLIIYNNAPGMMSISVADPAITIPVVIITEEDGAYVLSALSSGNVTIKAPKGSVVTAPATTGGQMSDFSSYGPSPELDIAPVVSAPGGNIYSTYPLKLGGFASLSGTSMATPYISGTAALFKQAHPSYNVAQLRQALATTARPRNDAKTGKDIHPYWSGSGLVNIYDAIKSRAEFSPSALALNNTRSGPLSSIISSAIGYFPRWAVRTVTIKNTDSRKAARISFTNSAADSLTPWAADGKFNPIPRVWPTDASTQAKWDTVPQAYAPELYIDNKIRPGQSRDVTVVVIAPYGLKDSERWFYGGFLNFTMSWDGESTGASSFVVPYAGFNGNYRQLDVLAEPSEGFPLLTDLDGNVTTAAITKNKPQLFSFRLELPSRVVSITLMDSAKKTLGYLPGGYLEYVSRNQQTQETLMYSVLVNGTVFKDTLMTQQVKVPAGQYQIQLNALRPLGNPKNPSDFQGWTSPAITFA